MTAAALVTLAFAPPVFLLCQVALSIRLIRSRAGDRRRWLVAVPPYTPWVGATASGAPAVTRVWAAVWIISLVLYVAAWVALSAF